jgi:protein O-GlcNAc transferase
MVSADILALVTAALDSNRLEDALAVAEQNLHNADQDIDAVSALAAIAFRQGVIAQPLKLLEEVRDRPGAPADTYEILAILNCLVGRLSDALYCGKMAATVTMDNRLIKAFGPTLPSFPDAFSSISERPLLRRAKAAQRNSDLAAATNWIEQHLTIFPSDVEALDQLADLRERQGKVEDAIGILRSVQTLGGQSATLLSRLGHALTLTGDFDAGQACHDLALQRAPGSLAIHAAALADWRHHPHGNGARFETALTAWRGLIQSKAPKVVRPVRPASGSGRRTIAYLCAAVTDDAVKTMIGRIVARHNRETTMVVGFGSGDLGDPANLPYRNAFRRWREISQLDELTFAALVRGEGIDVLIDCDGLAGVSHHGLFLRNAARLQLSWLDMPAGIALPGARGSLAGETLECGPVLLSAPALGVSRQVPAQANDGTLTFGVDITVAEFNADVAQAWSLILQSVPNSILALRDDGRFSQPEKTTALVNLFGNFGVAHRIDIISSTRTEFWSQVDIALASFPQSPIFTYGEAFASGIPVIALKSGAATELACALLATGEAQGMVATDVGDYVAKAVAWAGSLDRLAEFRQQAPARILASKPYRDEDFAACLEAYIDSLLAQPAAS